MSTRRATLLATLLLTFAAAPASASEIGTTRPFGFGAILGLPTGPSIKYYFNERHALDAALGLSFLGGQNFSVHADYLFQFPITKTRAFDLPFYIGIGGRLVFWLRDNEFHRWYGGSEGTGQVSVTVRVPIGIAFNLNKAPVDIFMEIVPGIGFFPGAGLAIDAAVGARYYF